MTHKRKRGIDLRRLTFDAVMVLALVLLYFRFTAVPRKIYDYALLSAVERGDAAAVKWLLDKGANPNVRDKDGMTALMKSIEESSDLATVQALLDKGADVNERGTVGMTALMVAASEGDVRIVRILLNKGVDVNIRDQYCRTALMFAAGGQNEEKDYLPIVQLLIASGAEVNAKDHMGHTALMWAWSWEHGGIAELLKKAGAKEPGGEP